MVGENKLVRFIIEFLMIAGAVIIIAPLFIALVTSFKDEGEIVRFQSILPSHWSLSNYLEIFQHPEEIPIGQWFFNSVFISGMTTFMVVTVAAMCAFSLARLNPPGSKALFTVFITTMMLPGQMFLVPVYLILNWLGWIDTPWALIVPACSGAFGVFFLRQFFLSIPKDLEDAAEIDGCSTIGIFWNVILPLSKAAIATLSIFVFMGAWNDFMGPLIFLDSASKFTLPVGIALFQTSYYTEYGLTLAAGVVATLPAMILFLVFQRWIIQSISMTGLKD